MGNNTEYYKKSIQLLKVTRNFSEEQLIDFMFHIAESHPSVFIETIEKIDQKIIDKPAIITWFENQGNVKALFILKTFNKQNININTIFAEDILEIISLQESEQRISAIKKIREITKLGLKEAKQISDEFVDKFNLRTQY